MSWIEKVEQGLIIVTGDGKQHKPLWANASKSKEYNASEFTYPETSGSYVERKQPQGTRYNLTLYFTGEKNLQEAEAFWDSADNQEAWRLVHPLYGNIRVQPLSLEFDDSNYNTTIVNSTIVETNQRKGPRSTIDIASQVEQATTEAEDATAENYGNNASPNINSIQSLQNDIEELRSKADNNLPNTEVATQFRNKAQGAIQVANEAVGAAGDAIRGLVQIARLPGEIEADLDTKLTILNRQIEGLTPAIPINGTPTEKLQFEAKGTGLLSGKALALSKAKESELRTRSEIVRVSNQLTNDYNRFLDQLSSISTDQAGIETSYYPYHRTQTVLEKSVNLVAGRLFQLIYQAVREKKFTVKEATNIFVLAHKLYGLDEQDKNLELLISQNNLSIEEYFVIPQGRLITYYA